VERGAGPDRVDAAGFVVLVPVELGSMTGGRILWGQKNGDLPAAALIDPDGVPDPFLAVSVEGVGDGLLRA
jgi:hypothetical protein